MLLSISVTHCASYSYSFSEVEQSLAQNQPAQALAVLEKLHEDPLPWENNELLYFLNKAMLLRMQQDYAGSNVAFEQAKKYIDQFDAISVTEQTGTFVVNDATRAYIGEDFEQILIHLYAALNYLELGDIYAARVEALQVDEKFKKLKPRNKDAVYTEDAFVRYLTGVLFEELAEWSDAMISYRQAYEAYQKYQNKYGVAVPQSLKYALLRLSEQQGLFDELERYKQTFNISSWTTTIELKQLGELVFVVNSGLAPVKKEKSVNALAPRSGQFVRIATPYYQSRSDNVKQIKIILTNKETNQTREETGELVENIDSIAKKTLEAQLPGITARAVARAVAKYQVTRQVQQQNDAAALIANVFNVLTERADTRSWLTLPKQVFMSRLALEPGIYELELQLMSSAGTVVETRMYENVEIVQQKTRYMTIHRVSKSALS